MMGTRKKRGLEHVIENDEELNRGKGGVWGTCGKPHIGECGENKILEV